jgi:hypothetical protein
VVRYSHEPSRAALDDRAKYVTVYRRGASGAVAKRGGRGFSYPKNQRDRDKAEVFETALAAVSREVAVHAARAARKTTGGIKKDASTLATGARRQAKRDAR